MTSPVTDHGAARGRGYTLVGPDGAEVLVLLHGVFFDRAMWAPVVQRLVTTYRVLAVDLPGHGELRDETFVLAGAIEFLKSVLAKHELHPRALVGLSLGGYVAMALVDAEPTMAPMLVVSGATREPRAFLSGPLRGIYRLLAHLPASITIPVARLAVRLTCPRSVGAVLDLATISVSGGFRAIAELPTSGFLGIVSRFRGAILVVNGHRDPIAVPGQRAFLGAMKDGTLIVVPGVGHLAPIQAPDAFTSAVIEWLQR